MARKVAFSSAHLYHQPKFSHDENQKVFGRCYTENGHGHNYVLEAFISGPIDSRTGLIVNLIDVDRALLAVTDPLDHQHLNFDIDYFKERIPTTEIIAQYCFRQIGIELAKEFPRANLKLEKVRLYETDDLYAEYAE